MGRDREIPTSIKVGVGVGVAYLLYRLLGTGSGLGSGTGMGRGMGRDPSRIPGVPAPTPAPVVAPTQPPDTQPVEIRVHPSPTDPTRAVIEMEGRIVSAGNLIARIGAGKRRDVLVTVRGDTRAGAWSEIRDALEFAGIRIGLRQSSISTRSSDVLQVSPGGAHLQV